MPDATIPHGFQSPLDGEPIAELPDVLTELVTLLEERVGWTCAGQAAVTPVANTNTSVRVDFPFEFPAPPHVVATANTGVIETTVKNVAVQNIGTTGFTLWVHRTNTTLTPVEWIARG